MSRLVVRAHRPGRLRMMTAIVLVLLLLGGAGLFEYGRQVGRDSLSSLSDERRDLLGQLDGCRGETRELRQQIAVLEHSGRLERESHRQLRDTTAGLQVQLLELQDELAFYRGIIAPEETEPGLRVQRFEIVPAALGEYRYNLVLTQVLNNDSAVSGSATFVLEGLRDGEEATLSLAELTGAERENLAFRFRYFQGFEGDLHLPEGFVPKRAVVTVDPRGRKYKSFERAFDWPGEEG